MPIEILTGSDVPSLLARAQMLLGEDAVVVSVRRILDGRRMGFEMVAADPVTASEHRRRDALRPVRGEGANALLRAEPAAAPSHPKAPVAPEAGPGFWDLSRDPAVPAPPPPPAKIAAPRRKGWSFPALVGRPQAPAAPRREAGPARRTSGNRERQRIIALVGPTGAGKTTTLAKLATHPLAFGERRVGVLCLDTWRVGAIEQARQFAELAKLPFEVAYESADQAPALQRLHDCEIVLVDTPGRGPRAVADLREAQSLVLELAPDEVHLVMPAGMQRALARNILTTHLPFGVTHLLPTKLDEYGDERTVFELARQFGLPMRWVADGQEVPRHLQPAPDTGASRGPLVRFAQHAEAR